MEVDGVGLKQTTQETPKVENHIIDELGDCQC